MSESYFAQYESPNIIIVPTVSFSPPHTEKNTDLTSSSPVLSFEQNTGKIITPTESDCHKNVEEVVMNNDLRIIDSSGTSKPSTNLLFKKQDTILNEDLSINLSHSIKEPPPSSKYKSRNNLVDLTGFNILKRDNMSSVTKQDDSERKAKAKTNPKVLVSDTSKKDHKISSKESMEMRKSSHREGNANKEVSQHPSDMEDKMKKYFKQLWRHSIEKIKDKSSKERPQYDTKSNRARENVKDPKLESNLSKSKLKKDSSTKSKSKYNSKEYHDFKRSFIAEHSIRSKSETKSSIAAAADRENYLSSIAMKRYKDFQNFIRHQNDDANKHKTEKQKKTESLHSKKKVLKAMDSSTNKTDVIKKVTERKRSTKSELHTKAPTNLDSKKRINPIKSVVQMTQKHANIDSKVKYNINDENQDLRSRLSRKRTRSEYLSHSKPILENQSERENLVITVKQDLNNDPKMKSKSASAAKIAKKYKKIKLVINIECSNTDDSDNSDQTVNECCTSPQDLSFLDDFNVDEIVNSLNVCHNPIENDKMNTPENSSLINKTIEKEKNIYVTKELKPTDRPVIDLNMKTKRNKKLKTEKNKEKEVIVIDSDAADEDMDVKTGSVTKTSLNQNEETDEIIHEITNRKHEKKQYKRANVFTKEIFSASNDELIKLKRFAENAKKRASGSAKIESCKIINDIKQNTNILKDKKTVNKSNENAKKRKRALGTMNKSKKRMVTKCEERFSLSDRKEAEIKQKSKDPIEVSLQSIFNNIDSMKMDIDQLNGTDTQIKEETNTTSAQISGDPVEASLESMFNNIKQEAVINMDTVPQNNHNIKRGEPLQNTEEKPRVLVIGNDNTEQDSNININNIDLSNRINKRIKSELNTNLKDLQNIAEISPAPMQDNAQKKEYIKTEIEPPNICDTNLKENEKNNIQKSENTTKNSLNAVKYNVEQKVGVKIDIKPGRLSEEKVKGKAEHLQNSKDATKTVIKTPIKNAEKKTNVNLNITPPKEQTAGQRLNESENPNKNAHGTVKNNKQIQKAYVAMSIDPTGRSDKKDAGKAENLNKLKEIGKTSLETPKNDGKTKPNIKIISKPSNITEKNISNKENNSHEFENTNIKPLKTANTIEPKTNIQVVKTVKKIFAQKLDNTNIKSNKTVKKIIELKTDLQVHITPQSKSSKNIKESSEDILKSKDTIKKSIERPTSKIVEKASINSDFKSTKTSDLKVIENHSQNSQDTSEESLETVQNIITQQLENQIDLEPVNIPDDNIKEIATHLVKSKDVIEQSKESANSSIQEKANITKNVETSTCYAKNGEADRSSNITVTKNEKLLPTVNSVVNNDTNKTATKSTTEVNRVISPKIVKNDDPKPRTIEVETNTDNSSTNGTKKEIETNKRAVIKMGTNSKTSINQKQVDNKKNVSNGTTNTDSKIQKEETKSKKVEVKSSPHWNPFVKILENRMFNYLDEPVTSLIYKGRFSDIYKCNDIKGDNYAIKVLKGLKQKHIMPINGMMLKLQNYASNGSSYILHIINSFKLQGLWCFMTEFYPFNLKDALEENNQSFHIDLVQVLSRQLVAAVNMLTDNDIIHSDIKPTHILLNSEKNRLKLTGFDRSNYSNRMNILPCTGAASYRAPEVILGFTANCRLDVWSTALVMFEMATSIRLFPGIYNNDILYKQICTMGSFELEMIKNSKFASSYFVGSSFIRRTGPNGKKTIMVHAFRKNQKLRNHIFMSYKYHWEPYKTSWQVTEDLDKLETFHRLLEQMLVLDPRRRLPIQFVSASEFIHDMFA